MLGRRDVSRIPQKTAGRLCGSRELHVLLLRMAAGSRENRKRTRAGMRYKWSGALKVKELSMTKIEYLGVSPVVLLLSALLLSVPASGQVNSFG